MLNNIFYLIVKLTIIKRYESSLCYVVLPNYSLLNAQQIRIVINYKNLSNDIFRSKFVISETIYIHIFIFIFV